MERMMILQLEEQPPLIQAVFAGELEQVRGLLEHKENVNYQDDEKRSALHAAAFMGDAGMTKLLIEHGARVNAKDSKWLTPLHRACSSGSEETMSVLLRHDADTSARDQQWQTPLHIAAAHNALDFVSSLLEKIPNPNVTDRSGSTALHHAVLNGHNDVAELLISKGCVVNACDRKDRKPLHWAAFMGHVDTIELLLRNGADVNVRDRNLYTPLHVAAASGMASACRILLTYGADVDSQNAYGNTPLHIACLNGHVLVCQELVGNGCDKEALNYRGQTPLHIAAVSTHGVHCLNYLVNLRVNINKQSLDGRTPLHMTAIHGRFTRSKTLIDRGAIVDCVDKNGCTALHIAAQHGHELLSNTLLSYGADASKKGHEGRTALHMCCLSGYVECCRAFIKAGVDINVRDDSGKTPTHCAAYKGSVECLDLLVSSGADFKAADDIGRTALHYAAVQGYFDCVFTLVGIGSSVNQTDSEGCTALHLAAAYDLEGRCVDYLIQHKADPRLEDKNGFIPVHYAVAGNNLCGLRYLLDSCGGAYRLYGLDMPPTTPLHIAAKNGNMEILEKLMPYFPDPNIKTEHGCSPLLLAAREGFANCVQLLLRFGAKVSICDSVYDMSPVHHSAKNGHVHCLALLVDNAEDKGVIDLPDRLQRTALMLAVSNTHSYCVLTLIKSGADPNVVDGDAHSCLFRSVVAGQHNILQMLLPRSSSVNQPDVNGKTVLHIAAACGRVSCLQRILHYMDRNVASGSDKQGFTALHWACYSGSSDCVEHLLKEGIFKTFEGNEFSPVHCATSAGSEKCLILLCAYFGADVVKLRDAKKRTPLHVASLHDRTECALYLLQQGAEIECKDEDGRTPLIAAAQNGQVQVIEVLIKNKADLTSVDKNGNTALHLACLQKHNRAALLLLQYTADPSAINVANNDRKTPLHLSARNGLVDVTRQLILKGSSVVAVDSYGLTPALCCAPNPSVAQCLAIILASYSADDDNNKKDFLLNRQLFNKIDEAIRTCDSQTEMSLLRDPDRFELEQMFRLKVAPATDPKYSRRELLCLTSSIVQNFFDAKHMKKQRGGSCFIVENYDGGGRALSATEKPGRDLHKSQSDMTLTSKTIYSEEDYGRIIQSSRRTPGDPNRRKSFRPKGNEFIMRKFLESTAMSRAEDNAKRARLKRNSERNHFLDLNRHHDVCPKPCAGFFLRIPCATDEAGKHREPKAKNKGRGGAKPKQKADDASRAGPRRNNKVEDGHRDHIFKTRHECPPRPDLSVTTFIDGARIEKCGDDSGKKTRHADAERNNAKKQSKLNLKTLSFAHVSPMYVSEDKPRCYPTFWCFPEVNKQPRDCRDLRSNRSPTSSQLEENARDSPNPSGRSSRTQEQNGGDPLDVAVTSPALEVDSTPFAIDVNRPAEAGACASPVYEIERRDSEPPRHLNYYDKKLKLEVNRRLRRRAEEEYARRNPPSQAKHDVTQQIENYALFLRNLAAKFDCLTRHSPPSAVEDDVQLIDDLYCRREGVQEEAAQLDREILGLGRQLVYKYFAPSTRGKPPRPRVEDAPAPQTSDKSTQDDAKTLMDMIEGLYERRDELSGRGENVDALNKEISELELRILRRCSAKRRRSIRDLMEDYRTVETQSVISKYDQRGASQAELRRLIKELIVEEMEKDEGAVRILYDKEDYPENSDECVPKRKGHEHVVNWRLYMAHRNLLEFGGEDHRKAVQQFPPKKQAATKKPTKQRKPEFRTRRSLCEGGGAHGLKESGFDERFLIEECDSMVKIDELIRKDFLVEALKRGEEQEIRTIRPPVEDENQGVTEDDELEGISPEKLQGEANELRIEGTLGVQLEEPQSEEGPRDLSEVEDTRDTTKETVRVSGAQSVTRGIELQIEETRHINEEFAAQHVTEAIPSSTVTLRIEETPENELQVEDAQETSSGYVSEAQSVTEATQSSVVKLQIEETQSNELQIEDTQDIIEEIASAYNLEAQSVTEATPSSAVTLQIEENPDNELQIENTQDLIEETNSGCASEAQSVTEATPSSAATLQIEENPDNELRIEDTQDLIEETNSGYASEAQSVTEATPSSAATLQIEENPDNELPIEDTQDLIEKTNSGYASEAQSVTEATPSSAATLQIEENPDNELRIENTQHIIEETASGYNLESHSVTEATPSSAATLQIKENPDNEMQIEDTQDITEETASGYSFEPHSVTEATPSNAATLQIEENPDNELQIEDTQDLIEETNSGCASDAQSVTEATPSSVAKPQIEETQSIELQVEDIQGETASDYISDAQNVTEATLSSAVKSQTRSNELQIEDTRDVTEEIASDRISEAQSVTEASPLSIAQPQIEETQSNELQASTRVSVANSATEIIPTGLQIQETQGVSICITLPQSTIEESVTKLTEDTSGDNAVPQSAPEETSSSTEKLQVEETQVVTDCIAVPQGPTEESPSDTTKLPIGATRSASGDNRSQIEDTQDVIVPQRITEDVPPSVAETLQLQADEEGLMTDEESDPQAQGVIEENDVSCATQLQVEDNVLSECTDVSDGGQDKSEEFHDFIDMEGIADIQNELLDNVFYDAGGRSEEAQEQNSGDECKNEEEVSREEEAKSGGELRTPKTKKSFPSLSKLGKRAKKDSNFVQQPTVVQGEPFLNGDAYRVANFAVSSGNDGLSSSHCNSDEFY